MIHCFKINDIYLMYDVESGSLCEVDELIYLLINNLETSNFSDMQISEARCEIDSLIEQGIINCPTPTIVPPKKSYDLKALCLHISHDCNLRCKYCFAKEGSYNGERVHMTIEVAKKAIDMLIRNSARKNLEVDFFGGEPLMNFDVVKQTVAYANEQGKIHDKVFKFTTTTNGVLLNEEISNYLNETMDNVVLSLDGRKEINDLSRPTANGKGSFDLVMDKFKYFKSIRGNGSYYIRGTFTHNNTDFASDVMFMKENGFDQISVEPVVLPSDHILALTDDDIVKCCKEYEKLAKIYVESRKNGEWFSFFHFVVDLNDGPCLTKRLRGCGAGGEYLAVAPTGEVYPCHQFVGNMDYLVGTVYSNDFNNAVRDKLISSTLLSKPACQTCWAKYHCSGGCNANAINFNNDINMPYLPACELMRKRLECALYVNVSEIIK